MAVWSQEHARALLKARLSAGVDRLVFANQHTLTLRQLTELEQGGSGSFYSEAIKYQAGAKLMASLNVPMPEWRDPDADHNRADDAQSNPLIEVRPTENRFLLWSIAWLVMAGGLAVATVNWLDGLGWRPGGVVLFGVGVGMALAIWRDRFTLAVWIMCLGALAINGASAWVVKGLSNISWVALPIAVMAAGWLLGRRGAWWVAGLSAAQALLFYGLHRLGFQFTESIPVESSLTGVLVALAIAAQVGTATAKVFQRQLAGIQRSQSELKLVLNSSSDMICSLDAGTWRLRSFNRTFAQTVASFYGVMPVVGQTMAQAMAAHPRHLEELVALLNEALSVGRVHRTLPMFNGLMTFDLRVMRVENPDGQLSVSLFASDVTEKLQAQRELEFLAYNDPVTQLPNRENAHRALSDWLRLEASHNATVSLVLVHLHDVKSVNEWCGHAGGDEYLSVCGQRMNQVISQQGFVYRMPGNEFLILLPGVGGQSTLTKLCERLFAAFAAAVELQERKVQITVSMGVASFDLYEGHGYTPDQMLACANLALDESMRMGPGTFSFYQAEMSNSMYRQLRTRGDLANAMFNRELLLHYQPIVDTKTLCTVGAEALVRWSHPRDGLLGPNEFIQVAEVSGYIKNLSRWALFAACEEAMHWRVKNGVDLMVGVNVSPMHFAQAGFVQDVQNALDKSGIAPGRLELEIHESTLIRHHQGVLNHLQALRAMGVKIVINDFGTGYSNLSYLRQFPIDKIKIDKQFVNGIDQDAGQAAIVKGLIEMARGNRLGVLAVGVERHAELAALQVMGCDQVQGYYFAEPMSVAEWRGWLGSGKLKEPLCQ